MRTMKTPKATTGTSYLPDETVERAESGSKFEKIKLAKDTTAVFTDLYDYDARIRSGELTWEEVEDADINTRLKWVGMLHRDKRTPGRFMMRLRTPNGLFVSLVMQHVHNVAGDVAATFVGHPIEKQLLSLGHQQRAKLPSSKASSCPSEEDCSKTTTRSKARWMLSPITDSVLSAMVSNPREKLLSGKLWSPMIIVIIDI